MRGKFRRLQLSVPCTFVLQPIFTMSAQQSQLKVMDNTKYKTFLESFTTNTVSKCGQNSRKTASMRALLLVSGRWMALLCPLVVRWWIFLGASVACGTRPVISYFDSMRNINDRKHEFNLEHFNESSTGFCSFKQIHVVFKLVILIFDWPACSGTSS